MRRHVEALLSKGKGKKKKEKKKRRRRREKKKKRLLISTTPPPGVKRLRKERGGEREREGRALHLLVDEMNDDDDDVQTKVKVTTKTKEAFAKEDPFAMMQDCYSSPKWPSSTEKEEKRTQNEEQKEEKEEKEEDDARVTEKEGEDTSSTEAMQGSSANVAALDEKQAAADNDLFGVSVTDDNKPDPAASASISSVDDDPVTCAAPEVIEAGDGVPRLVKVENEDEAKEKQKDQGGVVAKKGKRAARRKIRIGESPGGGVEQEPPTTLVASKPTKYHKPPKATSRTSFGTPGSSGAQDSGYSSYSGSSSPATFRGMLRGIARLLTGPDDDVEWSYKEKYSAASSSPDVRTSKEFTRKADRRAGRTKDLYTEENKEEWRMQCQTRAQTRDLDYIRDMQVVYTSKVGDHSGHPVVVAVGAHYSKRMIPREDILLHIVKEVSFKLKTPYSIVYFHSNVQLPKKPAVGFFKSLYAALGGKAHETNVKAIYVVHPSPLLRTWLLAFQLRIDPNLFKRVVYINSLAELTRLVGDLGSDVPAHVRDYDQK